ncbi:hypothetical protein NE857_10585 [Nocardiopsis exhalans]|uniref:Uncharacterized protein n=1 Tax=Nocardiopsis exhalans TaxID=163604 RepID=A0ABY5DF63_9ACTN|nr:hypothetical protein [Nocardiopsis exhalans]USY22014.1 hypothetical protein NE857_10585 [Nocardiopsis exhalans]
MSVPGLLRLAVRLLSGLLPRLWLLRLSLRLARLSLLLAVTGLRLLRLLSLAGIPLRRVLLPRLFVRGRGTGRGLAHALPWLRC